jgi:hypothetical protein
MLKYRPIQYVEDPFREEPRNIGVIAYEGKNAYVRFMGTEGDQVDTSKFASLSRTANESAWVFGEWVEWFRALANDFREYPESMMNIIGNLFASDTGISVGKESEVEGEEGADPEAAVDWLYSRLVTEPPALRHEVFKSKIEHLLAISELKYRSGFEYDIEIEFTPTGKTPVRVQLPYALTESPKAVFKIVRFQTGGAALVRQVNDAILTFTTVVDHGFVVKDRCMVLTDKPPALREGDVKRLSEHGVVIDVTSSDATAKLNAALRRS